MKHILSVFSCIHQLFLLHQLTVNYTIHGHKEIENWCLSARALLQRLLPCSGLFSHAATGGARGCSGVSRGAARGIGREQERSWWSRFEGGGRAYSRPVLSFLPFIQCHPLSFGRRVAAEKGEAAEKEICGFREPECNSGV
jgi:hypothetical protein